MNVRERTRVVPRQRQSALKVQKPVRVCKTCMGRGWVYTRAYSPCPDCWEVRVVEYTRK